MVDERHTAEVFNDPVVEETITIDENEDGLLDSYQVG